MSPPRCARPAYLRVAGQPDCDGTAPKQQTQGVRVADSEASLGLDQEDWGVRYMRIHVAHSLNHGSKGPGSTGQLDRGRLVNNCQKTL